MPIYCDAQLTKAVSVHRHCVSSPDVSNTAYVCGHIISSSPPVLVPSVRPGTVPNGGDTPAVHPLLQPSRGELMMELDFTRGPSNVRVLVHGGDVNEVTTGPSLPSLTIAHPMLPWSIAIQTSEYQEREVIESRRSAVKSETWLRGPDLRMRRERCGLWDSVHNRRSRNEHTLSGNFSPLRSSPKIDTQNVFLYQRRLIPTASRAIFSSMLIVTALLRMMFQRLSAGTERRKVAEDGYGVRLGTCSNASVKRDKTRVVLAGIVEPVLGVAPVNGNEQNGDRKDHDLTGVVD
ncbi:hypothetical protein F5146DRAFT_1005894 [Armillaria mellea]|nr:hypothetical protein F5146DRAFT_1005894 [Armillaria mellea]